MTAEASTPEGEITCAAQPHPSQKREPPYPPEVLETQGILKQDHSCFLLPLLPLCYLAKEIIPEPPKIHFLVYISDQLKQHAFIFYVLHFSLKTLHNIACEHYLVGLLFVENRSNVGVGPRHC